MLMSLAGRRTWQLRPLTTWSTTNCFSSVQRTILGCLDLSFSSSQDSKVCDLSTLFSLPEDDTIGTLIEAKDFSPAFFTSVRADVAPHPMTF